MGNIITVDSMTLLSMAQDHYNKEEYTQFPPRTIWTPNTPFPVG